MAHKGTSPGTVEYIGKPRQEKIGIDVIAYDEANVDEKKMASLTDLKAEMDSPALKWIRISGVHNAEFLNQLGEQFGINPLDVEAIANTTQRPIMISTPSGVSYTDQGMKLKANAVMVNAIISKKIAFLTPYLGFGITRSSFDFNFAGNFPVLGNFNTTTQKFDVTTLKDPIPLHYSLTQPGATIGLRVKLFFVCALHAQYTLQKYSTASVGFGLNFR